MGRKQVLRSEILYKLSKGIILYHGTKNMSCVWNGALVYRSFKDHRFDSVALEGCSEWKKTVLTCSVCPFGDTTLYPDCLSKRAGLVQKTVYVIIHPAQTLGELGAGVRDQDQLTVRSTKDEQQPPSHCVALAASRPLTRCSTGMPFSRKRKIHYVCP